MANPLFYCYGATARFDITPGSSSRAAYITLIASYPATVPVVTNISPESLAASTGLPLYRNVTYPGGSPLPYVPGIAVIPNPVVYVTNLAPPYGTASYPVATNVNGGTITGANWVDQNGVVHPNVDWEWQISIEAYGTGSAASTGPPSSPPGLPPVTSGGTWDQEVVTWLGDGTNNRLIPTTFDLTVGVVMVWIFPQATNTPSMRFTGMTGTLFSAGAVATSDGITALQTGGFLVDSLVGGGTSTCNQSAIKYTAVILRDATVDNRYMRVGSFYGWNSKVWIGDTTMGSPLLTNCVQATIADIGRTITPTLGGSNYVITGVNPAAHTMSVGGSFGANAGSVSFTSVPSFDFARIIPTGDATRTPTHLFVFNDSRSPAYRTDQFTGLNAVAFSNNTQSLTTVITAISLGGFTPGTLAQTQDVTAYFVALCIPVGDPVRQLFATFQALGTGSAVAVGVPFMPAFAASRTFVATSPTSLWRGPWNATVASQQFTPAGSVATQGITAFGVGSLQLGTTAAPNSDTVYGFALAGAGSVAVTGGGSGGGGTGGAPVPVTGPGGGPPPNSIGCVS